MKINGLHEHNNANIRESNIELLRILLMFFIVLHHLIVHGLKNVGYLPYPIEELCVEKQVPLMLVNSFVVVSVNCYVVISGYFGINVNKRKFWNLFSICAFYSILHYIVFAFTSNTFNFKTFIYTFFPFSHNQGLWFVSCYIGLFCISPMLNAATKYLNDKGQKDWIKVLGGLGVITIYFGYLWKNSINFDGYNLINFIFLYMIGRYLYYKKHLPSILFKRMYMMGVYIFSSLITFSIALFFLLQKGQEDYIYYWAWRYNSPFIILGAISLFLYFNTLSVKKEWINYIAKSTFAVYLIHENQHFNKLLYDWYFNATLGMDSIMLILILLGGAVVILGSCLIIDCFRRLLFGLIREMQNSCIV